MTFIAAFVCGVCQPLSLLYFVASATSLSLLWLIVALDLPPSLPGVQPFHCACRWLDFFPVYPYLRSLLVHGARSVIIQAATKDDRLSRWINRIRAERGYNKATVALANKMARIGWAVIVQKTVYQAA
ncbi:hypothetical protein [Thiolapillus sp.]|uniref:hypothetical protein n=1 Tax=Thiolapillus sp. TaxID=2017437 RepID=UPI003AF98C11